MTGSSTWTTVRDDDDHKIRVSPAGIRVVERLLPNGFWHSKRTYPDGRVSEATDRSRTQATKQTQRQAQ